MRRMIALALVISINEVVAQILATVVAPKAAAISARKCPINAAKRLIHLK
jgi:hypothetical protein